MKTAIRCQSLTMSDLARQSSHGRREDASSKRRSIRRDAPLVYGGLDLRALYDAHVEGAKISAGCKRPGLHHLMRFPPELLADDCALPGFTGTKIERQKRMLELARRFVDLTYGGDAVFAARLDRDEAGETIVDVFSAPRYLKETKRKKGDDAEVWVSPTKHGKELARKHQAEILRRHPDARINLTGPRAVGIALQSEWRDFMERAIPGIDLAAKVEKAHSGNDRIEKEQNDRIVAAAAVEAAKISRIRDEAEQEYAARESALEERFAGRMAALKVKEADLKARALATEQTRVQFQNEINGLVQLSEAAAAGDIYAKDDGRVIKITVTGPRKAQLIEAGNRAPVSSRIVRAMVMTLHRAKAAAAVVKSAFSELHDYASKYDDGPRDTGP